MELRIAHEAMRDLPGELHERAWRDFAYNRSEALELARAHGDYTFIIDADDALDISPDAVLPHLTADSYEMEIADAGIRYYRTQLVANRLKWGYRGVLHEFIECDEAKSSALLEGFRIRRNHDGARRLNSDAQRAGEWSAIARRHGYSGH